MSSNQVVFDLSDMIDQAEDLKALQEEARTLRRKAEGELILEAFAESNRSYDELMDFLNGYDN